jgi:hypothetical protein
MFTAPSRLPGDSQFYETLYKAAQAIKGVPGATMEIGLRRGGGTETIIRGCVDNGDRRIHMAIDPYGHIPYGTGTTEVHQYDYTNQMRMEALRDIYEFCEEYTVTFVFWPLTDIQLFNAFPDGLPFYDEQPTFIREFALVHFDGPHMAEAVAREVRYFGPLSPVGASWVFDDVWMYDHASVHPIIESYGFRQVAKDGQQRGWYTKA